MNSAKNERWDYVRAFRFNKKIINGLKTGGFDESVLFHIVRLI